VVLERETSKEVHMAHVLDRAFAAVPGLDRSGVHCAVPADLVVSTAPARLAAILAALLDNAVRHGGGTVSCTADLAFGDLVVSVADEGPGLGGADPESLFPSPGTALGESSDDGPVGVGLYVARMLARSLGGDVSLAERPEGGVVATVVTPQKRDDDAAPRTVRDISAGW
jgi:K+-sensing histidine kinase KdpD